jgi:soluble lytic murein transglycosylase-like protein
MDIIKRLGQLYGVDPFLIAAICQQESSGNIYAQRFEPNYRWYYEVDSCARRIRCSVSTETAGQQTSYGLMQVMGAVMRENGFAGWFGQAFDPYTNIEYGAKHLAKFLKKYDPPSAIASYNAGSPRYIAGNKFFQNQKYVDAVLEYWSQAKGDPK